MDKNRWLDWAKELQDIAQNALAYCRDVYDIERFERIREISAEMMGEITDLPIQQVRDYFCAGDGYQTPKIETRAAVFRDGGILLVQERGGLWAMPGGWVDYNSERAPQCRQRGSGGGRHDGRGRAPDRSGGPQPAP